MGKLVVCTNVSLDGVVQGPARGDEDARGGFTRGGWAAPYAGMMHVGRSSRTRARCCSAGAPTSISRTSGRSEATTR